ncbi:MAG: UTP--glucose-1-phosphate uridylyltransferase [Spirochaetia bacterium]|nr:UTP--glucose-1-phosphate uridylyltransferase [Spirochaetia bacterium]
MDMSAPLKADMEAKGIDLALTLRILDDINSGRYDALKPVAAVGVPPVDGRAVLDAGSSLRIELPAATARERLDALGIPLGDSGAAEAPGRALAFDREALRVLGLRLLDRAAYGVLNGGSATSYADSKRNAALGADAFEAYRPGFERLAPLCEGVPKGASPAWLDADGHPGESFLALKARAALLLATVRRARFGAPARPVLPLFQMSSVGTDAALAEHYRSWREHPWIAPLARAEGVDPAEVRTGVQPLIAAFTHSSEGRPRRIFDKAWGKPDTALALPGGHGQSFHVLADVYRGLLADGYKWAWLGNVDNLGYVPDPAELAAFALSGAPAAFEFARRTPVDVKGGILVETAGNGRTIADIGPAISFDRVLELERSGARVLFNCATGLFDLETLVPRLDELARELPVRLSDQDKDSGRYSQAEQVTWEVAALMDGFVGFAVDKYERFIAAKLLLETLMSSGAEPARPLPPGIADTARLLAAGQKRLMETVYGLRLENQRWQPR